jgi:hypothetical protein
MLRKLYTNSGLVLIAILAAGVWTSNVRDFLADRNAAKSAAVVADTPSPPPASAVEIFEREQEQRKYDDFELALKAPQGATAVCRDKTYSFNATRRGTCSGHGGVMSWLYIRQ